MQTLSSNTGKNNKSISSQNLEPGQVKDDDNNKKLEEEEEEEEEYENNKRKRKFLDKRGVSIDLGLEGDIQSGSGNIKKGASSSSSSMKQLLQQERVISLPRGGWLVVTSKGNLQFGIPPESIKDIMKLGMEIPQYYVIPRERFCRKLGPCAGMNVAEFEFPAYWNFFIKRRKLNLLVDSADVKLCIQKVFRETLLGPENWDSNEDYPAEYPIEQRPDLLAELAFFQKFGDELVSVDKLLGFEIFDHSSSTIFLWNDTIKVTRLLYEYVVYENDEEIARIPLNIELPIPESSGTRLTSNVFSPPLFGVTVLGNSHGFDEKGITTGYILWVNRRGLMIDPPPHSANFLHQSNIPPCLIDGVIITHCHADHDAGTFQKILQEGRITLITTPTIMKSFIRKYCALSGLDDSFLQGVFRFRPVRIGETTKIRGGEFKFFYTLHSIPCAGFQVSFGGKTIAFSADHMNDPRKIKEMHEQGVLTKFRRDELLNFPWNSDLILHEAGVPPIHTPIETLNSLSEAIKSRLYVVHTTAETIPKNSGLRVATPGVEHTIIMEVETPFHSEAIEILELVANIDIFKQLTLTHAREILTIAKSEFFGKGRAIIRRGEIGNSFYIIVSGIAEVRIARLRAASSSTLSAMTTSIAASGGGDENSEQLTLKQFTTGDYFGEQALISEDGNNVRSADIYAVTDVHVIRFLRADFHWLLHGTQVIERMRHIALTRAQSIWETMECNSMLARLSASQKTQLEEYFHKKECRTGETIWTENDATATEHCAILIDSGTLSLELGNEFPPTSSSRPSTPIPDVFLRGAFIADVDALLSESPIRTTLKAKSPSTIYMISRTDLLHFFQSNPGVLLCMLHEHFTL